MSTLSVGRPYGMGFDLGPAPYEMYSFAEIHGADVGAVYGEDKDYNWKFLFTPTLTYETQSASFMEWRDLVNVGNTLYPEGLKWRAVNQFPTVTQYDADFNLQSSVRMYAGTGLGVSGACNIQQIHRDTFPPSFTYVMPFIYKRPATTGAVRTLMSTSRIGGVAAWLYFQRLNDSFDKWVFQPDQTTVGTISTTNFAPLVENSLHVIALSFQDSTKKSEIWVDGALVAQFTHSIGIDLTGHLMSLGSLSNGTSALDERFGTVGLSTIPMAARDGGGNLSYGDMLPGLMKKLMAAYSIP